MERGRKREGPARAEDVSIRSSSDEGARSPKRAAAQSDAPVTLQELRNSLAEQTKQLVEIQADSVNKAVQRLEKSFDERFELVDTKASRMEERVEALEKQIEEMLRQGAMTPKFQGLAGDDSARRARTLVYGGWPRETRKKVILEDLQGFVKTLGVQDLLDHEPFTTGARRSMALSGFQQRAGESFQDMRSRMHKIVLAFSGGGIQNKQGGRIWCSYSKSRAEREKGSHPDGSSERWHLCLKQLSLTWTLSGNQGRSGMKMISLGARTFLFPREQICVEFSSVRNWTRSLGCRPSCWRPT